MSQPVVIAVLAILAIATAGFALASGGFYGVVLGVVAALLVATIYGTITRSRWGINLGRLSCPRCGEPVPAVRRPDSAGQAMWGGHTCRKCGTAMDKWGREIAPGPLPAG